MRNINKTIYFDNAATTQVNPIVANVIQDTMQAYGNPSSLYSIGEQAKSIVDYSRHTIAKHINAKNNEIIFTSSGSEANNLALKGFYFAHMGDCTIITSVVEHKAILNSCAFLEHLGANIKYVFVDSQGLINMEELESLCKNVTGSLLVSIQFANNEIGTIQNIKDIADIVHKYNGVFHTDAVQAFPETQIDVNALGIDMMSISGHKFNVPKGIGFLYKRNNVKIEPLIHGGQQEYGLKAGTENVPYIAGLAKGVELLDYNLIDACKKNRNYLINELQKIDDCIINGSIKNRLANNISISFKGIEGESLLILLNMAGICVSSGSACNSSNMEPSHVLTAINVSDEYIHGTIRLTIGSNIMHNELDCVCEEIKKAVKRLREFSD